MDIPLDLFRTGQRGRCPSRKRQRTVRCSHTRQPLPPIRRSALIGLAVWLLAAGALPVRAHQHWVVVEDFTPTPPCNLGVTVASGHYFPDSSFALKDKVLHHVDLIAPDGERKAIDTHTADKQRIGDLRLAGNGVYLVSVCLKRPRAEAPSYEARCIMTAGSPDSTHAVRGYHTGKGLEIVPRAALHTLRPGDALPLALRMDGERIGGTLEVSVEGGKAMYLRTRADEPAALQLPKAGRYLVTTHMQGRGASLVFHVAAKQEASP